MHTFDDYIGPKQRFDKNNYIGREFNLEGFGPKIKILDAKQLPPRYTEGPRKWDRRVVCLIEVSNQYETTTMWADWGNIRRNRVRNPMTLNHYGGYMGIGEYKQSTDPVVYDKWIHVWMRVTEEWRKPYNGVTINPLWRNFQKFAKWSYDTNISNFKPFLHLDKDIFQWYDLHKEYGPDKCVYIPKRLNYYLSAIPKRKGGDRCMSIRFGNKSIWIPSYVYTDGTRMPTLQACRQYMFQVIIDTYNKHGYLNKRVYNKLLELNMSLNSMTDEEILKYSDPDIRRRIYNLVEETILHDIENEKKTK